MTTSLRAVWQRLQAWVLTAPESTDPQPGAHRARRLDDRAWWQRLLLRTNAVGTAADAALRRTRERRATPVPRLSRIENFMRRFGAPPEALGHALENWSSKPWLSSAPLRWLAMAVAAFTFWLTVTTPLGWFGQMLLFVTLWLCALATRRVPGMTPTLVLIALSVIASCRYGWWRLTQSIDLEPGWETFLGWCLLGAEIYAWLIMVLGFVQSAVPLKRQPVAMPADRATWPTVDVFIPTFHEPLSVVEPTVLAARSMDWPAGKLNIYLLDDGDRDEMRAFAEAAGVHYLRRSEHSHAKAGNLNNALHQSRGEFIAFFDCDHMPTRTFLTTSMGWMMKDAQCAMVQTPQHFFSPDPFERNLDTFRRIPNEGKLFYGVVQEGNDFWNAAFFCGSCAVVRRKPLEEIGGVAIDTVTEDAHTALRLHRRGYNTAYIGTTQAAGLATESLAQHVAQRTRWARGMAQIFRLDNPMFGPGLSLVQRLCYSNAMLHFFYGIPRLIFLTAPLAYLFFEFHIIRAEALMILVYALPHVVLPHIANAHLNGPHRHTFWAEVYETVLAWYVAWPTTLAFLNPRLGRFNPTAKGGLVQEDHFDWRVSRPYLFLVLLNLVGFVLGLMRLFSWNSFEAGTVLLNLVWTTYNLAMLGAAIGVARERRQVRVAPRVTGNLPVCLVFGNGQSYLTATDDYSLSGLGVSLPTPLPVPLRVGDRLTATLSTGEEVHSFPIHVTTVREHQLGVSFEPLDLEQRAALVQCTLARADAWTEWQHRYDSDLALQGLQEISLLAVRSYGALSSTYVRALAAHGRRMRDRWRTRKPETASP